MPKDRKYEISTQAIDFFNDVFIILLVIVILFFAE